MKFAENEDIKPNCF